jgi:hypothetical protein
LSRGIPPEEDLKITDKFEEINIPPSQTEVIEEDMVSEMADTESYEEETGKEETVEPESQDTEEFAHSPDLMAPFASEQTGFTTTPQPTLWWYLSDPWHGKVEFTLNEVGAVEPIFETYLNGPNAEGIYSIHLADYHITLKPNVEYEWFLAILLDPEERSADFLASATIKYVPPSESLTKRLTKNPKERHHFVYAEEGYWYDTIETLCERIKAEPQNNLLRKQRAALLRQVKLPLVAVYDDKGDSKD